MSRVNGFGTTYLGATRPDETGRSYATVWYTFFFFPVFPISRHLVKYAGKGAYQVYNKTAPVLKEVLLIYLLGWIIFPLIIFAPSIPALLLWPGVTLAQGFGSIWLIGSFAVITVLAKFW